MQRVKRRFCKHLLFIVVLIFSLLMPRGVHGSPAQGLWSDNGYQTGEYQAKIKEEFELPTEWLPGQVINTDVSIVNDGSSPIFIKAKVNLQWLGQDELTKADYGLTFITESAKREEYAALISWGAEVVILASGLTPVESLSFDLPVVDTIEEAQGKWVLLDEVVDQNGDLTLHYVGSLAAGKTTPLLVDDVQMNPRIEAKIMGTDTIYNKTDQVWETKEQVNSSSSYENARFVMTVTTWSAQVTSDTPTEIDPPKTGDETTFMKYIIMMLVATIAILTFALGVKKGRKQLLTMLLCFIGMGGAIVFVYAEDSPIPYKPDILELSGTPLLSIQPVINASEKFLRIGQENGSKSEIQAPFNVRLRFPVENIFHNTNQLYTLPSTYILDRLTLDPLWKEWDLAAEPELKLPENPDYELHVGDAIGAPTKVRWGARKTGLGPYVDFPFEHFVEYLNTKGQWVRVYTRSMGWNRISQQRENWGNNKTVYHKDIYWKLIAPQGVYNVSPKINGVTPIPDKDINIDNTGIIEDTHIYRTAQLGNVYDFLSGIEVIGAVTNRVLNVSSASPIPNRHFRIEHDLSAINHLITDDKYTAIGSGDVISKVTDYEGDATIFTQNVIVSTNGRPDVNIYRAQTDILYKMEWMSNDQSADEWRRKGLDIQAYSTINGSYDLLTKIDGAERQSTYVTKTNQQESVTNERIEGYTHQDTSAVGIGTTSIAYAATKRSEDAVLSAESEAKYMRFDSTLPTISAIYFVDNEWESVLGHDAADELSGLDVIDGGVHYLFVKRGETTELAEIKIPSDGSDWMSLEDYQLPSAPGEYDLYVYAKDNATNRSAPRLLNEEPIVIHKDLPAKVRIEKKVANNKGNDTDIFLINIEEKALIGSVALKRNEVSEWMTFEMAKEESITIKVSEVVPMDYTKEYHIYVSDSEGNSSLLTKGESEVTIKQGDEITITIENEFSHAGYFRGKDAVKNNFWRAD